MDARAHPDPGELVPACVQRLALDPHFERELGSAALRQQWFSQMLQLAFVGGHRIVAVDGEQA
jgi:hypothetical protein